MAGPVQSTPRADSPPIGSGSLDRAPTGAVVTSGATPTISKDQFARLFQEHARTLWCIAAAVLGDRERARDVVQDASIVGLGKLSEFSPGTSFAHWMGQIVRFTALNEGRKQRPRSTADVHALPLRAPSVGVIEPRAGDFDARTREALGKLEETARTCLLMRTVLDMSYRNISEALGIAEGTAMSHVHRSRARVRDALSAKGGGADV